MIFLICFNGVCDTYRAQLIASFAIEKKKNSTKTLYLESFQKNRQMFAPYFRVATQEEKKDNAIDITGIKISKTSDPDFR